MADEEKSLPERLKEKVEDLAPKTKAETRKPRKPVDDSKGQKPATAKPANPKPSKVTEDELDPDFMFKAGFLSDVYAEKPSKPVVTRFPPEPNGFLHIGHAKAIAVNFGFARFHGGDCYLRFDDTNPEKEEEIFFTAIEDIIKWLGYKPCKVTYSSDNFDKLYTLAEELIKRDGAYVCHCSPDAINMQRGGKDNRGKRFGCPHRDRPTEESLREFQRMREGEYKPKEAYLRMKQKLTDPTEGNPQMWDLPAYRVLDKPHHRTGDKWKIYPTYDFTHCLCDSFEGITHSLCTTEFEQSRVSYEWLCDAVGVYKPMQREYGRLSVAGTVLSKRKIAQLVDEQYVRGWDDPRLYTLIGLRRRGIPPRAILSFVNELGVSKSKSNIQLVRLEQSVRKYLEKTVPRLMLVLNPVPVIIDNLPDDYLEMVNLPFAPKDPIMGTHSVPFTKTIYIDRDDFREEDHPDFFRLAPGKVVGLLNGTNKPYLIKATTFEKDESGLVKVIHATIESATDTTQAKKAKTKSANIHWVGKSSQHKSPTMAEVRVTNPLFKSDNPDEAAGGFLKDVRDGSETVYPNAMIEVGFEEIRRRAPWPEEAGEKDMEKKLNENGDMIATRSAEAVPESVRFQGMRVAYFCMDKDSTGEKIILNRIVSLKEDAGKGA